MFNLIARIKFRIARLFLFMKLGWGDYDWDWLFLITVLNSKLMTMEEFWNSDKPCVVGADKTARQIKICRILTDRLLDEYKYYWHKAPFGRSDYTWGDKHRQADIDYLFKVMAKRLQGWWD